MVLQLLIASGLGQGGGGGGGGVGGALVCDTSDLPCKERYTASQNRLPRCQLEGLPHEKATGECHTGIAWLSAQSHVLKLICRVILSLF